MKRVAYLRCSTADQVLDSQRCALEKYFKAHGLEVIFYEEIASGGSTKKRPIFNKLLDEIRLGLVSHVYVYKIDRFARNTKDFLNAHAEMESAGVKFISITDNLDFSTPIGRMFAQLLSIFAEFEKNQIVERTIAGLAAAKARGVTLGPPEKSLDTNRLQSLVDSGMEFEMIAKSLGFSKAHLYKKIRKSYGSIKAFRRSA